MPVRALIALIAIAATLAAGCAKKTPDVPIPPSAGPTEAADAKAKPDQKIKVTAYINVSSGCQASTVKLVDDLAVQNVDLVDLEIVNFGSTEGYRRWQADGMDCMGILFDDGSGPSPALKFKGRDGKQKTVVFFMPAGFGWSHEDLEDAFAALKAGELDILSEDEAKQELAPRQIDASVTVKDTEAGSQILVADKPAFTIATDAGGAKAADRAAAAKKALEEWLAKPVQPGDIHVSDKDGAIVLQVGTVKIVSVTDQDAEKAGAKSAKDLAMSWAEGLKKVIVGCAIAKQQ